VKRVRADPAGAEAPQPGLIAAMTAGTVRPVLPVPKADLAPLASLELEVHLSSAVSSLTT
jgi:hypothetical protein